MHRFRQHESAEFAVVGRLTNHDAGLIRLAVRSARNEILLRDVIKVRQVISLLKFHQCFVELAGSCDFRRRVGDSGYHGRWILGLGCLSALTLSALALLTLSATLSLDRNR